jgi:hypothetical protein
MPGALMTEKKVFATDFRKNFEKPELQLKPHRNFEQAKKCQRHRWLAVVS